MRKKVKRVVVGTQGLNHVQAKLLAEAKCAEKVVAVLDDGTVVKHVKYINDGDVDGELCVIETR